MGNTRVLTCYVHFLSKTLAHSTTGTGRLVPGSYGPPRSLAPLPVGARAEGYFLGPQVPCQPQACQPHAASSRGHCLPETPPEPSWRHCGPGSMATQMGVQHPEGSHRERRKPQWAPVSMHLTPLCPACSREGHVHPVSLTGHLLCKSLLAQPQVGPPQTLAAASKAEREGHRVIPGRGRVTTWNEECPSLLTDPLVKTITSWYNCQCPQSWVNIF